MDEKVVSVVKYCVIAFLGFLAVTGGCTINKQRIMAQMVEHGADPIKAHCAVYLGETSAGDSICATVAISR